MRFRAFLLIIGLTCLIAPRRLGAQSDSEALENRLLSLAWSWKNLSGDSRNIVIRCHPDGTVTGEASGARWHWKISGPRSVLFTWGSDDEFMDASFDPDLTRFVCTDQNHNPVVTGECTDLQPLQEALLSSTWSWNNLNGGRDNLEIHYDPDGTVTGGGQRWRWRISGARSVHFTWQTENDFMDANFDPELNLFVCTDQNHKLAASGERLGRRQAEAAATPQTPDSGALERALLSTQWSWNNLNGDARGTQIRFHPDGTVTGGIQRWHWRTSGPRSVHFTWGNEDEFMDANFDSTFSQFLCTDQNHNPVVAGERLDDRSQAGAPGIPQTPNPGALEQALLSSPWSWNNLSGDARGTQIHFHPDGLVTGGIQRWHWRISGPSSVHFTWGSEEEFMDATFDSAFSQFRCTDQNHNPVVAGERLDGRNH